MSTSERPKGSSLKPLRALLPFLAPYSGRMWVAFFALLVAAAAMLALPQALKNVIDHGFTAANAAAIDRYFLLLLVAAAVFAIFASLRMYLVNWIGERVVADLRSAVYARVIRMDPAFFEVTKTGEVLSRLTTDTTLIQSLSGIGLSILLRSTVSFVGSLVLLLLTNLKLALIIFALIPTVLAPMLLFGRRVRRLSRDSQDRVADTSGLAGETLNAIQTVQAFTLEGLQGRRYDEAVEASFTTAVRRTRVRAWLIAFAIMTMFSAVTLVLWLGARSVLDGTMSGGDLAKFLSYAIFMGTSVAALSEMWGELQRASGAMERTIELLQSRPSIVTPAQPIALEVNKGAIRFEHIRFNYPSRPDTRALEDFNVEIAPGETVAFVGPSGAGKSTVFQLLLRFYDPGSGRILIDGTDIAHADPSAVRARIGLVPQETMIFGASARENIRYGRPGASDADIEAAARAAAADEFITRLPQGYDTYLGERGARLSGGQKQRIAIARAILKNPPILLLDEATSALDSESEQLVRDALEKLMKDRTTLIIAHRRNWPARRTAARQRVVREARGATIRRKRRQPMAYIDGFLIPVPKKNAAKYKKMSLQTGKVWLAHGALEVHECVAEDVMYGKLTSFPQGVKLKKGEQVWFSWIVYKSRKDRDRVNAKAMKDPRLAHMMDPKAMPFDGKRMVFGGFRMVVDL